MAFKTGKKCILSPSAKAVIINNFLSKINTLFIYLIWWYFYICINYIWFIYINIGYIISIFF
jgi:hypothetical protein